jgi:hypothetical protein
MSSSGLRATNWLRFVILTPVSDGGPVAKMTPVELCVDSGRPVSAVHNLRLSGCDRMRPDPKACRNNQRVDSLVLPPDALVAAPVELTMVQSANGHGKPVADLAPHGTLLRTFDVMGI